MTPDQYYETFVLGNYDDFKLNTDCMRRAFNAAVAASHLADHYFEFYNRNDPSKVAQYKSIGKYVEHISQNTRGDFKDIRSIANAYKHLYTGVDPSKAKHSSVSSAGTVYVIQVASRTVQKVFQNYTKNTPPYAVFYTRKTGDKREFLLTLETVINYWDKEINL